jgi:hypothetical protein
MGKFHRVLDPGVNVLVPVLDRVKYVQSLKEIAIDIPQQSAITIGKLLFGGSATPCASPPPRPSIFSPLFFSCPPPC